MSDRFLHWANRALDNQFVGQRLLLCRKAAEALCKIICAESFPDSVGNSLSRMIDFLYSKQMLDDHVKAHLDVIRIYCNLEAHDNESSSEVALPAARGALSEIKKWYEKEYDPHPKHLTDIEAREEKFNEKFGSQEFPHHNPQIFEDSDLRPSLSPVGDGPFNSDELYAFLDRFGTYPSNPKHNSMSGQWNTMNFWFICGRQASLKTLRAIRNPIGSPSGGILEDLAKSPSSVASDFMKAFQGMGGYGFKFQDGDLQEFRIDPLDPSEWNIVVMGQEACLQYLFEKNLSVTQEDVFNHPLHSKHPAVTKYKNL
jgi:hypothetical protein